MEGRPDVTREQNSTLRQAAVFYYKVFSSSQKHFVDALCWQYRDSGLDNALFCWNQNSDV